MSDDSNIPPDPLARFLTVDENGAPRLTDLGVDTVCAWLDDPEQESAFLAVTLLARVCNIRLQAVSQWKKNGVPGKRCLDIERASGERISCARLLSFRPAHDERRFSSV